MNKQETIEQLKAIVKPYIQNQEAFDALTEDTDFINDLKINSANLVDVILDIEEKYNIIIDNESMEQMVNVKAAIQIIDAKLSGITIPSIWYSDIDKHKKIITKLVRNQRELKRAIAIQLNHRSKVNKLTKYIHDNPFGKIY